MSLCEGVVSCEKEEDEEKTRGGGCLVEDCGEGNNGGAVTFLLDLSADQLFLEAHVLRGTTWTSLNQRRGTHSFMIPLAE